MSNLIENLQYLSLEGGGGRGILYVEPINELENAIREEVFRSSKANAAAIKAFHARVAQNQTVPNGENSGEYGTEIEAPQVEIDLPVVNITGYFSLIQISTPPHLRKIKGLSGSSAGAITAFMLSLGMSSEDIKREMARTDIRAKNAPRYKGPISVFEQFVDEKPTNKFKQIVDGEVGVGRFDNIVDKPFLFIIRHLLHLSTPITWGSKITAYSIFGAFIHNLFDDGSPFALSEIVFGSLRNAKNFFGNLIGERGLFVGLAARRYFSSLIEKYLYPSLESLEYPIPETPPGELTFRQFYDLTGVDLVLTGTNISRQSTLYFSVYHTPDFPVVEAVQISMTLPGVFKPVYVDTPLRGDDTEQRTRYQGLFVDGGMLNNYPIHAFDHVESTASPTSDAAFLSEITYRGQTGDYPIAGNPKLRRADCDCVLGMRLQDKPEIRRELDKKQLYPSDELVLGSFLKDLLSTYMSQSEKGQIRSVSDEERSVELYATVDESYKGFEELKYKLKLGKDVKEYSLSVMDFSSPAVDRTSERGREFLAKVKEKLIDDAAKKMTAYLRK